MKIYLFKQGVICKHIYFPVPLYIKIQIKISYAINKLHYRILY